MWNRMVSKSTLTHILSIHQLSPSTERSGDRSFLSAEADRERLRGERDFDLERLIERLRERRLFGDLLLLLDRLLLLLCSLLLRFGTGDFDLDFERDRDFDRGLRDRERDRDLLRLRDFELLRDRERDRDLDLLLRRVLSSAIFMRLPCKSVPSSLSNAFFISVYEAKSTIPIFLSRLCASA